MFDLERWQEIFDTIRKNKLRTFLTGLSVASGIFILVILLGFGQGMQNGIAKEFESDSATSIWIWTETTQKAHKGLNPGRQIQFRDEDYTTIVDKMDLTLDQKSAFYLPQNITTTYKDDALIYRVMGTTNGAQFLENQDMLEGRFITIKDESQVEKVAVISDKIQREAFTDVDNPVGEYIKISNIPFKIIGVYKDKAGEREENRIFIPITTAQKVFNGADKLDNLVFSSPPAANFDEAVQQSITLKTKIDTYLRQAHSIAPDDEGGIGINNQMENAKRFYALTGNIKLFFWFVGLSTLR